MDITRWKSVFREMSASRSFVLGKGLFCPPLGSCLSPGKGMGVEVYKDVFCFQGPASVICIRLCGTKGRGGRLCQGWHGASEDAEWSQCVEGSAVPLMVPQ